MDHPPTILHKIGTLVLVSLLTVLIWCWAESESQRTNGGAVLDAPGVRDTAPRTVVVDNLPVRLILPADAAPRYRVEVLDTRVGPVALTGPGELIARLRTGPDGPAIATLTLTPEMLTGAVTTGVAQIEPPVGTGCEPDRFTVRLKITPR